MAEQRTPYEQARKGLRWAVNKGYLRGYEVIPAGEGETWERFVARLPSGAEEKLTLQGALMLNLGIRLARSAEKDDGRVLVETLEWAADELDAAAEVRDCSENLGAAPDAADRARAIAARWRDRTDQPKEIR